MGALTHLVDHALEAVLELALDRCPRLQQPHVQHMDGHPLQRRRHIAFGNAQCQAFDHGGLADAGLTREDRVVLAAAHQDVDGLADFQVTPNHGIDLAIPGTLREVGRELVERRGLACAALPWLRLDRRGGARHGARVSLRLQALGRAGGQLGQLVLDLVELEVRELTGRPVRHLAERRLGQQRQQQVAAADARRVRRQRCDQPGVLQPVRQVRRKDRRARVARAKAAQLRLDVALQRQQVHAVAPGQHRDVAVCGLQQGQQQVLDIHLVVTAGHAQAGGTLGGTSGLVVELGDEGLEVLAHGDDSVKVASLLMCGVDGKPAMAQPPPVSS